MKTGDLFTAAAEKDRRRRHAERVYRTYLAAGWDAGDARRCAERDVVAGLWMRAFSEGDVHEHQADQNN
jgi:hypothetical protein